MTFGANCGKCLPMIQTMMVNERIYRLCESVSPLLSNKTISIRVK